MFYKRKKVVHLNFKNASASHAAHAVHTAHAAHAAHSAHTDGTRDNKDAKEPHAASAEHILRLKFEKNMRKLFGVHTMCSKK
jgi:hypothetical protein